MLSPSFAAASSIAFSTSFEVYLRVQPPRDNASITTIDKTEIVIIIFFINSFLLFIFYIS